MVTGRRLCGWAGCDRLGSWLVQGVDQDDWYVCSIHHPAGRLHIEERTAERDRLLASKDALVRKVKRLEDRLAEKHHEAERLRNALRANQSSEVTTASEPSTERGKK